MSKPLIFISHISEEKEIALALKDLIESSFLGMLDVFVSSDYASVNLGQKWLDDITTALNDCVVEIIICSPVSVERQWINFEAGAGWIRNIPVIPLCHSGIEPNELPIPLKLLQAGKVTEEISLKEIFRVLVNIIGSKLPNTDLTEFIKKARNFELQYVKKISSLKKPSALPPGITGQPGNWYYHFRVQRLITTTVVPEEPKYVFNQNKNAFITIATKLHKGQNIQIAGLTIGCQAIDFGLTSIIILRSKAQVDSSRFIGAEESIKEQYWNAMQYSVDVVDITAELVITNPHG